MSTISQLLERYLYYADVCAFHHYPAWYPTNVPGNMDEVKQIPLIWEAGGFWMWNHSGAFVVFGLDSEWPFKFIETERKGYLKKVQNGQ